jgi:peptidoglycan/LPS O-acetylase OafA/YrhL
MATARLSRCCRILTVTIVAIFVYRSSRWDFLLFLAGMLIAELDLISGVHNTTSHQKTIVASAGWSTCPKRSCSATPWIFLSIVALYFLSQPDANGHMTPGWIYLCSLVPKWWSAEGYRYWQSIGAVLFVFVVGRSTAWQRLFNSNVVQYLGKISYALYLMHGPAMHVVGYHFEKWAYSITGVEGYWFNAGFVLHACFCIPTVIWWADIFWRAVDIPTVRFAKWFERKCIAAE